LTSRARCNYAVYMRCDQIVTGLTIYLQSNTGGAITQVLVAVFPPRLLEFEPGSDHVGIVVDKAALGHVFSEYFGFPS
jgi:hypothetical protein